MIGLQASLEEGRMYSVAKHRAVTDARRMAGAQPLEQNSSSSKAGLELP